MLLYLYTKQHTNNNRDQTRIPSEYARCESNNVILYMQKHNPPCQCVCAWENKFVILFVNKNRNETFSNRQNTQQAIVSASLSAHGCCGAEWELIRCHSESQPAIRSAACQKTKVVNKAQATRALLVLIQLNQSV